MSRWLVATVLALALAVGLWAQTAPVIEWQHDGVNVTEFKCQIDSGDSNTLGLPTPSGGWYSAALSTCGTLTAGKHLVYIYACNAAGCTAATAITVVKL